MWDGFVVEYAPQCFYAYWSYMSLTVQCGGVLHVVFILEHSPSGKLLTTWKVEERWKTVLYLLNSSI